MTNYAAHHRQAPAGVQDGGAPTTYRRRRDGQGSCRIEEGRSTPPTRRRASKSASTTHFKATALVTDRFQPSIPTGWTVSSASTTHAQRWLSTQETGLITPIVTSAEAKGWQNTHSVRRWLAGRKGGKLQPNEFQGGTNHSVHTSECSASHCHHQLSRFVHPGCGRDQGQKSSRPATQPQDGQRHDRTLSCDHQVVDGAVGAHLLQKFKKSHRAAKLNAAVILKVVLFCYRGGTAKWISHTQP